MLSCRLVTGLVILITGSPFLSSCSTFTMPSSIQKLWILEMDSRRSKLRLKEIMASTVHLWISALIRALERQLFFTCTFSCHSNQALLILSKVCLVIQYFAQAQAQRSNLLVVRLQAQLLLLTVTEGKRRFADFAGKCCFSVQTNGSVEEGTYWEAIGSWDAGDIDEKGSRNGAVVRLRGKQSVTMMSGLITSVPSW